MGEKYENIILLLSKFLSTLVFIIIMLLCSIMPKINIILFEFVEWIVVFWIVEFSLLFFCIVDEMRWSEIETIVLLVVD